MSTLKYNPFKPGKLVHPAMFCGRHDELKSLEKILFQTKNGNPEHFIIHGERGIGKSSLMLYLDMIAKGDVISVRQNLYKFLTIRIDLQPNSTFDNLIIRIGNNLKTSLEGIQDFKRIAGNTWDFIKKWEVLGIKYKTESDILESYELLDELTNSLSKTIEIITNENLEYDGILVLIDEADKSTKETNVGEFAKLITEQLQNKGCDKIALGFAGTSKLIQQLRDSHESAPRIFQILELDPLQENERIDAISKGLNESKEKNELETTATQDAKELISTLSEGYPHFIQQFAYCAFDEDTNNEIDYEDVINGAFKTNGAFNQLCAHYFQDLYFDQIGSDDYRIVLKEMSKELDRWVKRVDIKKATKLKEHTLSNAIKALTHRGIIVRKPGSKGVYRLPNRSFAVWIRGFTTQSENGKEDIPNESQ